MTIYWDGRLGRNVDDEDPRDIEALAVSAATPRGVSLFEDASGVRPVARTGSWTRDYEIGLIAPRDQVDDGAGFSFDGKTIAIVALAGWALLRGR